jgi:hypothetical protein
MLERRFQKSICLVVSIHILVSWAIGLVQIKTRVRGPTRKSKVVEHDPLPELGIES